MLILLVLIQLPKKDAGAGLAFGGGAADALFGAGSGNVLTKITKYAAGVFIFLAIFVSAAQTHLNTGGASAFNSRLLSDQGTAPVSTGAPSGAEPTATPAAPATTGSNQAAPQPEAPTPAPASTNK